MNKTLIVCETGIRQDSEGRYCLNDLHRAAGNHNKHRPSIWFANQQARELAAELEAENPASKAISFQRGRGITGTYVGKELVYAYAMWISPAFHLKVIRAYDELQTQGIAFSERAVSLVASGEVS